MKYSVLYFSNQNIQNSLEHFKNDENCVQIVVSAKPEQLLKLAQKPMKKVQFVSQSGKAYVDLFNGLKAISQDNVILVQSDDITEVAIQKVYEKLQTYPAVSYEESVQGFDTRLLMFCLQYAIEMNVEIESYMQAVSMFASTPIAHVEGN